MSETEKKGSPWPWILVPIAAFTLFFVLRECQHRLPPAASNAAPAVAEPATTQSPADDPMPEATATAPAPH